MAIIASASEGKSYTPIEEGTYFALCYGLIDVGDEYSEKFDKCSTKFLILWELIGAGTLVVDGKEVNRTISKSYTNSLSPKSNLRKDLRAWRGREFTDDELKRFDMVNILGAPCQIQIVNSNSNGKVYSNIAAIMNLPKGMPKPTPTEEKLFWDFEDCEIEGDGWDRIPKWVQERIKNNETYQYITTNNPGHLSGQRIEEIQEFASFKAYRQKHGEFPDVDDDEEIPF